MDQYFRLYVIDLFDILSIFSNEKLFLQNKRWLHPLQSYRVEKYLKNGKALQKYLLLLKASKRVRIQFYWSLLFNNCIFAYIQLDYDKKFKKINFKLGLPLMMSSFNSQFEFYRCRMPDFIQKLYLILQNEQFSEHMAWLQNNQILIKNTKKFEDQILPQFFRHKKLSSFIRQLNMYGFSKVNKLMKEKNHMYFKNEYFCYGKLKEMTKIKRNTKKNRKSESKTLGEDNSDNVSINEHLLRNEALNSYKQHVKQEVKTLMTIIEKIEDQNPLIRDDIYPAIKICEDLLELQQEDQQSFSSFALQERQKHENMLSTMRIMPKLQSLNIFSECSLL